jgi:hypothetical protein
VALGSREQFGSLVSRMRKRRAPDEIAGQNVKNSRCRLRKALCRCDKSRSSQVDRGCHTPREGERPGAPGSASATPARQRSSTTPALRSLSALRPLSVLSANHRALHQSNPRLFRAHFLPQRLARFSRLQSCNRGAASRRQHVTSIWMGSGLLRLTQSREKLAVRRELLLWLSPDAGGSGRG